MRQSFVTICNKLGTLRKSCIKQRAVVVGAVRSFIEIWDPKNEAAWKLRIRGSDPTRLAKPKSVGDFRLRGSVFAGITGRFVVSVAQVTASSNAVDGLWYFPTILVVVERWESGRHAASSKAVSSPSFHGCIEQRTPPGCDPPKPSAGGGGCSLFARGATCGEHRPG
jgi:hypothetical protein